jgi:Secretion system C-terminal sorting domain
MKKLIFTAYAVIILNSVSWTQSTCVTPVRTSLIGNQAVYELRLKGLVSPQTIDAYSGFLEIGNGTVDAATFTLLGVGNGGGSLSGNVLTFNLTDPDPNPTITSASSGGFLMGTVTVTSLGVPIFSLMATEVSLGGGGGIDMPSVCDVVLPTELLSFKGNKKGAVSQIQWEATNEKNIVNYIVERSSDGRNFHPLGFTKPKSFNATEKVAYDFIDDSPAIGINYYRLLSKGFGKDEKYSKVISLDFGLGLSGRVYPNPLDTDLTVELDIEDNVGTVDINIYDLTGKQILSKKIQNSDRRVNMTLPTADLPPGSYLVKVKVGSFNWERQITKM